MNFYSLCVQFLARPTDESVSITFEVPSELKKEFKFRQGQYVTLRSKINGEDVRRNYSICSCPLDDELSVVVKQVEGGKFSTFANNQLQQGDFIDVMPPMGNFYTRLNSENEKVYVAFAGGSGITPVISIIETTLRTEPKSTFWLFYANKKTSSIIFHERLEGLKNRYLERFSTHHVLSEERIDPEFYYGFIDDEKLKSFSELFFMPEKIDEFFICGPEPMMLTIRDALKKFGVNESKIHIELFTSLMGKSEASKSDVKSVTKAKSEITIILDGHKYEIPYNSDQSILDVAYQNGLDLPFACKGGVCSTCVCKVKEGEVDMVVNYALEPDELKRGMVLSCQSIPKSKKVTLSFDL